MNLLMAPTANGHQVHLGIRTAVVQLDDVMPDTRTHLIAHMALAFAWHAAEHVPLHPPEPHP